MPEDEPAWLGLMDLKDLTELVVARVVYRGDSLKLLPNTTVWSFTPRWSSCGTVAGAFGG